MDQALLKDEKKSRIELESQQQELDDLVTNAEKTSGFYVDKNAPWRFFADVNSVSMKEKMAAYGYTSMENMFDTVYYKAYFYDMEVLKTYLISFYI